MHLTMKANELRANMFRLTRPCESPESHSVDPGQRRTWVLKPGDTEGNFGESNVAWLYVASVGEGSGRAGM